MTDYKDARNLDENSQDRTRTSPDVYASEIQNALESDDLPEFYANSFTVTMGTGDILLLMKRNQKFVGIVQMSYTVAKSLAETLSELIELLETRTGNEIMTSKFIEQKIQENKSNDSAN